MIKVRHLDFKHQNVIFYHCVLLHVLQELPIHYSIDNNCYISKSTVYQNANLYGEHNLKEEISLPFW